MATDISTDTSTKTKPDAQLPQQKLSLPFSKMHGLGNDFVMLERKDLPQGISLESLAACLCDRHFGIGGDGLIVVDAPSNAEAFDIKFTYLNSDGSWAEMCGNGIRCFARFVVDKGYLSQTEFTAETLAGPIRPSVNSDGSVKVNMGAPRFVPAEIPTTLSIDSQTGWVSQQPVASVENVPVSAISMGNPHALIFQQDLSKALDPAIYGPQLEVASAFPKKTNVEFLTVKDEHTLDCVVWERGCGFTLACGTGACASAVGAIRLGKVKSPVQVNLPGGPLSIEWDEQNLSSPVFMTGPATYAFSGVVTVSIAEDHTVKMA